MGEEGIQRLGNYIWDDTNNKWVKQTASISGVGVSDFVRLANANDLITVIQYNETDSRTTVGDITYSSSNLNLTAVETFVSGTNTLTITRIV